MDFFKKRNALRQQRKKEKERQKKEAQQNESPKPKSQDVKEAKYINSRTGMEFSLTFVSTLIDEEIIQKDILPDLLEGDFATIGDISKLLPVADVEITTDMSKVNQKMYNGYVLLQVETDEGKYAFISAQKEITRTLSAPEIEFSVIGPKEAFVEALDQNLNLIRKRLPIPELIIEELTVGKLSKTKVAILYIDQIVDMTNVQTIKQRIDVLDFDMISDSSFIEQLLADNHSSPFPQFLDTERPDRAASVLGQGKVVLIVDGSPHALIGPTTFVEFFVSFEDYYLNWIIATFFRLLRVFSVTFSILVTPLYVAALTYHYQMVPRAVMATLISSRQGVPLPPILEALVLEITIELLREAGARLPTKIGQTIGIVGGIVIGTASVEAGLTSNVLLIFVALAALASFTTPVYKIGNTIRFIRFPFLIFAQMWGLLGIVFCFCILLTHLIRLTSLGRPYFEPLYPPRIKDIKDTIIRLGFNKNAKRPQFLRTQDTVRFPPKDAKRKLDIDE
ncbi:spore germination protein [Bacillus sporothermodurans]|uniref:spore germination protein n=1 Tax=Heyndrickxia sporothermodurans TaxID=46224 RepID=UPI00192B70EA|nr:spore germination protein [Heyndrickxia sporothermodurans]MBL5817770.1 spore germination protein [Heyndrickxia sporothermodurans]